MLSISNIPGEFVKKRLKCNDEEGFFLMDYKLIMSQL